MLKFLTLVTMIVVLVSALWGATILAQQEDYKEWNTFVSPDLASRLIIL